MQTITTTNVAALAADADIDEDGDAILKAIREALAEARTLGGHAQEIESVTIEAEDGLQGHAGKYIVRSARISIRTRLT